MVFFSLSKNIRFLDACVARFRKAVSEEEGWQVPQEQGQALCLISEPFLSDLDVFGQHLQAMCVFGRQCFIS